MLIFAVVSKIKLHSQPEQVGWQGFVWVSIFILDFVSSWFRVYSIYIAGPRTEKVSNAVETLILNFYRKSLAGNFLITLLAEIWVSTYLAEFSRPGSALHKYYVNELFTTVRTIALTGASYRIVSLLIELKQAFYRIIDLDVEDYQAKALKKTAESKGKK